MTCHHMALVGNLLQVQATGEDGVRDSSSFAILFITQWNRPLGICEMNKTYNLSPTDIVTYHKVLR